MGNVRTAAKVDEIPLLIKGDDRVGELFEKLDLVFFAKPGKKADRLFAGHLPPGEGELLRSDIPHPGFDLFQVVLRERPGHIEIVVETVFNCRADGDARLRKNRLYGLGHYMGGAVPEDFNRRRRIGPDTFQSGVLFDLAGQVDQLAVELCGDPTIAGVSHFAQNLRNGGPFGHCLLDFRQEGG